MAPFKLALVLIAAGNLPFPAPKLIPVTDALRSDVGTVASIDSAKNELKMNAPAGQITYKVGEAQVVGKDGKAMGTAAALQVGQNIRVYYVVDNGAIAKEIDVSG
jgi:hypothetical protein